MADPDFSVLLPESTNIVGAPVYNPGPNPIDNVLGTISSGLSQFENDMKERAKRKKEEKEAAEEAREKEARGFMFDQLTGKPAEPTVGRAVIAANRQNIAMQPTGPAPIDSSIQGYVDPAEAILSGAVDSGAVSPGRMDELASEMSVQAEEYGNVQSAISQGNMPRTASPAMVDRVLMETRAKFPDVDVEVILSMMEKAGLKSQMFYEVQRSFTDVKDADDTVRKQQNEWREVGMEILGVAAGQMSDTEIIATGARDMQIRRQREEIAANLELEVKKADLTERQIAMSEKQAAQQIQSTYSQQVINQLAPVAEIANKLILAMPEAGSSPALEQQLEETMGTIKTNAALYVENAVAEIAASGIPNAIEEAEGMRSFLTKYIENTIIKPLEDRDSSTARVAKKLKDKLGLSADMAFPVLAVFREAGINMPLTDVLLESLSPQLSERLSTELTNLSGMDMFTLTGRQTAQIQMTEIIGILQGNTTLAQLDMDPKKAKESFKTISKVTTGLSADIARGDLSNAGAYLNGMAEVAVAAGQISPGSDTQSLINAAMSLSGYGGVSGSNAVSIFGRLMNGEGGVDPEHAQAVALGQRAATARIHAALKDRAAKGFGAYDVVYNRGTGKWEAKLNKARWEANPRSRGASVGDPMDTKLGIRQPRNAPPPMPKEARTLANVLNLGANNLINSAKWDENAPKVSEKELRAWYNEDRVPKKVVDELAAQKPEKSDDSDVMRMLGEVEDYFLKNGFEFNVPTRPGPAGASIDARGRIVMNDSSTRMASAAKKAGFSEAVVSGILANVLHESGFDPSGVGDSGTAFGYFQHRRDRVDNFEKVTGAHPRNATPEQAIKFFKWELDNPEKAGMTKAQAAEIKAARTPQEAAMLIQRYYERPKNVDPERGQSAQGFYQAIRS